MKYASAGYPNAEDGGKVKNECQIKTLEVRDPFMDLTGMICWRMFAPM